MKPKYNFFKNSKFAFEGLAAMLKNEAAFRFELCIIVPLALVSLFLPVSVAQHALLIAVFGLVLICECLNTAVEAVVDLVSPNFRYGCDNLGMDATCACLWRVNLSTERLSNLRSKSKSIRLNFTPNN